MSKPIVLAMAFAVLFIAQLAFAQTSPPPPTPTLILKEGTSVALKFAQALGSRTAAEGDPVNFVLAEDIKLSDVVVAREGAKAIGEVTHVKKAGMMGKGGELNVRLDYLRVGDVKVRLRGTKGREGQDSVGATVALTVLFGPIGLIKHGKDIEIKEGAALSAFVADDVNLPAATPPAPVAAPVQEGATSAQPAAVATLADGKPATLPPATTSAPSSPAPVEWEGEQQWPGLRFSISFSKGATEITNLKVRATCLEGTSSFEETKTGPGGTLPIAADGSFGSVTVRNSSVQEIVTGRFHADESAEGIFESGISLGCAAGATPHFKVSGKWQARPKKPVAGRATSAQPAAVAMSAEQPASAQNNSQNPEQIRRGAGPQKQLCLCAFRLDGTSKAGNIGGVIGGAAGGAVAGSSHSHSYYGDINKEVQHVYETVLRESGSFQYVDSEKLIGSEGGKPLSLTDTAAKNKLFACASAKPYWAARMGWDKQAAILTKWEIAGPGGCKLKFKTSVASEETYGKFPNGADPALKPVYLELSKEDAKQFLEAFQKAMKKAGCGE